MPHRTANSAWNVQKVMNDNTGFVLSRIDGFRYRNETRSDALFSLINLVLSKFASFYLSLLKVRFNPQGLIDIFTL